MSADAPPWWRDDVPVPASVPDSVMDVIRASRLFACDSGPVMVRTQNNTRRVSREPKRARAYVHGALFSVDGCVGEASSWPAVEPHATIYMGRDKVESGWMR